MPTAAVAAASTHIIGITNYKARYHFDEKMNIRSYFPFSYGVCFLRVRCARLPTRMVYIQKNNTWVPVFFYPSPPPLSHIYKHFSCCCFIFCTTFYVLIIVFMLECGDHLDAVYIELLLRARLIDELSVIIFFLWMISENGQYIFLVWIFKNI